MRLHLLFVNHLPLSISLSTCLAWILLPQLASFTVVMFGVNCQHRLSMPDTIYVSETMRIVIKPPRLLYIEFTCRLWNQMITGWR